MNDINNQEQGSANGSMDHHNHAMCRHGMCCGHGHRFFWLRWLLGIVILAVVFSIGVKVGEFKGEFGGQGFGRHGGYNMMYGSPRVYNQGQPWGMMQGYPVTASTTPAK